MADCVGVDSVMVVAGETHKRIRRLLSDPFSMSSLPAFIQKFDKILCQELKTLEGSGKRFSVLALGMKVTINLIRRNKTRHPVLEISSERL